MANTKTLWGRSWQHPQVRPRGTNGEASAGSAAGPRWVRIGALLPGVLLASAPLASAPLASAPLASALLASMLLASAAPAKPGIDAPFAVTDPARMAPFGSAVGSAFTNYSRVAPAIATAGAPGVAGIEKARALGFRHLIDLRGDGEPGVADETRRAAELGLRRSSIPMPMDPAAIPAFVDRLASLLEASDQYPALMVCGSANRTSAAWALYRVRRGVPPLVAIEEARAAGLTPRGEVLVREALGLAPEAASGD